MQEEPVQAIATEAIRRDGDLSVAEVLDRLDKLATATVGGSPPSATALADLAADFAAFKERLAVADPQLWSTLVFLGFFGLRFADWPSRPASELAVAALEVQSAVAEVRKFVETTQ